MPVPTPADLQQFVGNMDVYLFDQVIKGRLRPGMSILDAGCGSGRNSRWFLQSGFDVWAIDQQESSIAKMQSLAQEVGVAIPGERLQVGALHALPFADATFDAVLCIAVLHFAQDHEQFDSMTRELWRVLKPGGMLLVRTASSTGMQGQLRECGPGRYQLPDGSERYLVSDERLQEKGKHLDAVALEPIKTTVVHAQRSMSTWCVGKKETAL